MSGYLEVLVCGATFRMISYRVVMLRHKASCHTMTWRIMIGYTIDAKLHIRDIRLTCHVMSRDHVITYWANSIFETSRGISSRFNPTSCMSSYRGRVTYFSVDLHQLISKRYAVLGFVFVLSFSRSKYFGKDCVGSSRGHYAMCNTKVWRADVVSLAAIPLFLLTAISYAGDFLSGLC